MISLKNKFGNSANGFLNTLLVTTSQNWTVPSGIYRVFVRLQGAGQGGAGKAAATGTTTGVDGGNSGSFIGFELSVRPGDVLTFAIGAKGLGGVGLGGTAGGNTTVSLNGKVVGIAYAGGATESNAESFYIPLESLNKSGIATNAVNGNFPIFDFILRTESTVSRMTYSPGSTSPGNVTTSGGGGANSRYGRGGNGGATNANGENAPSDSYGAGGGGSGQTSAGALTGGNAADGVAEVLY